jgi:heterodisulfide reductase subunit A
MIADIQANQLDGIVVASCSPKLHLHTFRNVAIRAGLNPMNYVQVNVREQCSWPHSDKPREATVKAAGLIRAGINRVIHSESLDNIEVEIKKSVLVIGAGVSGMKAAIELANNGHEVFLIEKEFSVGGHVGQTGKVFMTGQDGKEIVDKLYQQIKSRNNITLFTGAVLDKVSGSLGNFQVEIKVKPRHLNAANVSQVKEDERMTFIVGSVLVATGFDHYQPKEGEYGYGHFPQVITLPEFNQLMDKSKGELMYQDKPVGSVAFIYCVGSRQTKGENKYCSRTCCNAAVHTSLQLKEKFGNIRAYHLFRDIRTYGKHEVMYEASCRQGDVYLKYEEKEMPVVSAEGKKMLVKVKDYLTAKKEIEIPVDMVVLVTGMVAREDSARISEHLKIPVGNDKFFNEIHPKLKPVETVIKGVYIGGSCQGPRNISESVQSALSAAAKVNTLLSKDTISVDPVIARINPDACIWCGKCADVCDYTALKEVEVDGKRIAAVNKAVCTGCGICAPVCPENAIEVAQFTDKEIESMIDGFTTQFDIPERQQEAEESEQDAVTQMKEYPQVWKEILAGMTNEQNTIPQIAENSKLSKELVTWHLMTMNKYGIVQPAGMDEKELYFYYKVKNH